MLFKVSFDILNGNLVYQVIRVAHKKAKEFEESVRIAKLFR